jgi:hypothetical protein
VARIWAEGLVGIAIFAFWIWALFDCISTDSVVCRNLPKGMWLILVLFLPLIGALAWLLLGRPERAGWRPGSTDYSTTRRPIGLEDHPRYSPTIEVTERRSEELNRALDEWEQEQARKAIEGPKPDESPDDIAARQAELDERELELRRREFELRERELREREPGQDQEGF